MPSEYRNIYKTARKAAGLTQEAAAEKIGISVESIRAYETGGRIPPNEIVSLMVICYNAQHLAIQHLQETNDLMSSVIPTLTERDMLKVCVRIYNRIRHISTQGDLDKLLIIAEDGVIDDTERPEYDHILDELREIVRCGLELSVFCDGEEHGEA